MHSTIVSSSLLTLAALLPISGAAPFAVTSGHDGLMIEDNPLEGGARATGIPAVIHDTERTAKRSSAHVPGAPDASRIYEISKIPVYDIDIDTTDKVADVAGSSSTGTTSSAADAATETAASASKERRKVKISSSEEEEGSTSLGKIWDGFKDVGKGLLKGTAVTAGSTILGDIASNEAQSAAASSSTTAAAASTAAPAASKERRKVSSSSSSSEEEEGSSSLTSGLVDAAKDFGKSTLVSAGSTILGSEIANEVEKHLSPSTTTAAAQQQRRSTTTVSGARESKLAKAFKDAGLGPNAPLELIYEGGGEIDSRSVAASLGKATGKKATHEIIKDEKNKNKTGSIEDEVKSDLQELKTKITDLLSELEDKDKDKDSSSKVRTLAATEKRSPGLGSLLKGGEKLLEGTKDGYDLLESLQDNNSNQKRSPKLSSLLKGGEKVLEGLEDGYDLLESSQDNNSNQKRSPKLSSLLKGGEKVLEGLEDGYDLLESSQDNSNQKRSPGVNDPGTEETLRKLNEGLIKHAKGVKHESSSA
ncbi:hypothetical protein VPNG_05840 [Cytospora leucostoma]|uniref:Uncharacterized protein n=1 Tax=Cytospora leucostoma TaxID=1230097 RepID=A0A423X0K6_9PEZI|nr:hypothetical protein VPNG_05840 [Cytospora leucostoma]